jgi:hypothetical protein
MIPENSLLFRSLVRFWGRLENLAPAVVFAFALILTITFFNFIYRNSVNIMFWDQWDFYNPLFNSDNLWEMFRFQHGPHRQGVGLILTNIVANLSNWNTQVESLTIGVLVFLSMIIALYLKKMLLKTFSISDIAIPLIFLTTSQAETFIGTPNPAHGAFPLLLIMLYCIGWTNQSLFFKYFTILLLNFLLIYTGFGIFISIITVVVLCIDIAHAVLNANKRYLFASCFALFVALFSMYSFTIGYSFNPAGCFVFPHPRLWEYPLFTSLMFAHFHGLSINNMIISSLLGGFFFFFAISICFYTFFKITQHGTSISPLMLITFILISFSLIFSLNTSLVRICNGLSASQGSRYMTSLIPAFFGFYLFLVNLAGYKFRSIALIIFVTILFFGVLNSNYKSSELIAFYTQNKTEWKQCYLSIEEIRSCELQTGFQIYPNPEATQLQKKLDFFKSNKYNLFIPE